MLYFISFLILFLAAICNTLHSLFATKGNKHGVAFVEACSTALWCIKIVVVMNQPLTIVTAFIGAYIGSLVAFKIHKLFDK